VGDELGRSAAAEAIEQTTLLKGAPYEEEVTGILQAWAQVVGAEVHHVGVDNQPGDWSITLRAMDYFPTRYRSWTFVIVVRAQWGER
jgi:hypothetical protein